MLYYKFAVAESFSYKGLEETFEQQVCVRESVSKSSCCTLSVVFELCALMENRISGVLRLAFLLFVSNSVT